MRWTVIGQAAGMGAAIAVKYGWERPHDGVANTVTVAEGGEHFQPKPVSEVCHAQPP